MTIDLNLGDTQLILSKCRKHRLSLEQTAYVLATAYWETARTMKPVREAYWLSESWRRNNLRYYPWYGRGYVQLTWEDNYKRASQKLNLDLTTDADAVMEPEVSAEILVVGMLEGWFTGKRLSQYINNDTTDYVNARRIVNGTDRAREIADLAKQYEVLLDKHKPKESLIKRLIKRWKQ